MNWRDLNKWHQKKDKNELKDERYMMSEEMLQKQEETCDTEGRSDADINTANGSEDLQKELDSVRSQLDEKTKQCEEYLDKLQRTAAEFENFKKRSMKEKETRYIDAVGDVVCAFIPVLDNVERALQVMPTDSTTQTLKEGVEMVFKQFKEALKCAGVEEIKAINEPFDPMLHNAVMHIEDEAFGTNTVVEEFQKGYICKDKVIRYSMVKVAN